jgi:hypothetical protein
VLVGFDSLSFFSLSFFMVVIIIILVFYFGSVCASSPQPMENCYK